jgi:hypothetical protein
MRIGYDVFSCGGLSEVRQTTSANLLWLQNTGLEKLFRWGGDLLLLNADCKERTRKP